MSGSRERPEARGGQRFSLGELTHAAGVSVRTVRYYIAEGLLPPPAGGGPRSHYTAAHLDRLRLIARLKAAYLPLKEIRRRLAGLDDAEVRRVLAAGRPEGGDAAVDDASAYLDRVLGSRSGPSAPRSAPPPAPRLEVWGIHDAAPSAPETADRADGPSLSATAYEPPPSPTPGHPAPPAPMLGRAYPASFPAFPDAAPDADPDAADEGETEPETWHRVPLGDDAELLIREGAYRRRRDRVDWLVAWARKVFG